MIKQQQIIDIILKHILTPVIYMNEFDDTYEFICFCDRDILMNDIYNTENILSELLNKQAVILDIRELSVADRIDIIQKSSIIYYEDEAIKKLFEISMLEDFNIFMNKRNSVLERIKNDGTPYLS